MLRISNCSCVPRKNCNRYSRKVLNYEINQENNQSKLFSSRNCGIRFSYLCTRQLIDGFISPCIPKDKLKQKECQFSCIFTLVEEIIVIFLKHSLVVFIFILPRQLLYISRNSKNNSFFAKGKH